MTTKSKPKTRARKAQKQPGKKARHEPIRWTLERACSEFGINPRTITARVKQQSIEAGTDGKYSTAQMCAAVFGDFAGERLRKIHEEADKVALDNAVRRGELIELADLERRFHPIMVGWRQCIMNSKLTEDEQRSMLTNLEELVKPKR